MKFPTRQLHLEPSRYQALVGTGGVGSGIFWKLEGNATLGREESRAGSLLARKDYCKLHIISHYVKVLMGSRFKVIPAGEVGNDAVGQLLLKEMAETGLDTRFMVISESRPTLFSVCFLYPDGSGGNLTASNSASAEVGMEDIERLEGEFARWRGTGIALAAPEVPLEARIRLLELGGVYQFFRAACLTSEEARSRDAFRLIGKADLLAINLDEAAALAGVHTEALGPEEAVDLVLKKTRQSQPGLLLSLTAGRKGSWIWDGNRLAHYPAFKVEAVSTAGAGDAHLAGLLAGLAAGLPLGLAAQLASLSAALSVTSPDTIHPDLDCAVLLDFALANRFELDPQVRACLAQG